MDAEVETIVATVEPEAPDVEGRPAKPPGKKGERRPARLAEAAPEPRPGEVAKLTKEQKEKKAELDRLSPHLWSLYQQFRGHQREERSAMIRGRYEQGRILLLAEKHHRGGLMAVGRAAGATIHMIRECHLVARRVSEEEVMMFISAADADPTSTMGWVHLTELAAIESPEDRIGYIRRAAKQGLSVDQLRQAIAADGVKVYTDGARAGAGRPFALPDNPVGLFDRYRRQAEQLERFMDQASAGGMASLVRETPLEKIGPDGLAKMQDGCQALRRLRDALDGRLAEIESVLAEVATGVEASAAPALDAPEAAAPAAMPPPAASPADRPPSPAFASAP